MAKLAHTAKLLLCLLLSILCQSGRLPIQAHSFNDLDYVTNLISRGVDNYKMDVSMANRQSCQKYSTWNKSNPCIKTQQYIQQICCLSMRGDASSRPNFQYPFNTSTQFVKFLDNALAKIVINQPKRRLLFAVNFQYSHTFDDPITQQFLSSLADIMIKYPHNLLLGTGMDSFILQYDRICYGKGAPQCTDTRRKISRSNMFLQSGGRNPFDPRDYYKRFRNFNLYYKGIDGYCKDGFPQWINNHPQFPLIFWQPSDEKQVRRVLDQFLNPSCIKKHGRNLSTIAIATNMDPQMYDVYSRKLIEPITFSDWFMPSHTSYTAANISWQFNTQKIMASQQIHYRLTKTKQNSKQTVYTVSSNTFTNRLLIQKWQYSQTSKTMQLLSNRQLANLFKDDQIIQQLMQDGLGHLILITYRNQTQSSNKAYKIYYFNSDTLDMVSFKDWSNIDAAVMRDSQIVYVTCQANVCRIKGAIQFKQTKIYAQFDVRAFMTVVTGIQIYKDGYIIVGESVSRPGLSIALLIQQGSIRPPQIPLSYGTHPKIFKKQSGKQYGILLSNAMCHCAVLFNNNNHNKCNFFLQPQLSSMRNVRGVVNLLQFNLQDLIKNRQIISPCHQEFILTKIMIGANSDIVELPTLGSYLLSSQYVRVEDQDFMAALFCGASNFQKQWKYKLRSSVLMGMYLMDYVPPMGDGDGYGRVNEIVEQTIENQQKQKQKQNMKIVIQ